MNDGGQPGGAGIGIGTGSRDVESFVIDGNHCAGNARFGIFVESQTTKASGGGRIVANTCEGNKHGIGDCGMGGAVIIGNVCVANVGTGIVVNTGTLSPIVGRDGLVVANVCTGNGDHGIHFDTELGASAGGYAFRGNRCSRNGKTGIKLTSNATRPIAGIAITDNDIHHNGSSGIHVSTAGAPATDLTISANRVHGNGQLNTAGFTQGIRVDVNSGRLTIADNGCWDAGSPKTQTFGIQLSAGTTVTDGDLHGNHVHGNATGGLNLAASFVRCHVTGNAGHVPPAPIVITPAPSPWTYTAGHLPEVIYLRGGVVTSVVKAGRQLAASSPASIVLRPGEQITTTYSAPPSVVADRG